MTKILFSIDSILPYHVARLNSLEESANIYCVETFSKSEVYSINYEKNFHFHHILMHSEARNLPSFFKAYRIFNSICPDVVFVSGWGRIVDLYFILISLILKKRIIVISDSQYIDFPRNYFSEKIKSLILGAVSGVFVAGKPQKEYALKLGVSSKKVYLGCDVVDNAHFSRVGPIRQEAFILVARLIEKKNIFYLLDSFTAYKKKCNESSITPWKLIIVGSGPLANKIREYINLNNLTNLVSLVGNLSYENIISYYHSAGCLLLVSSSEQWGLVVNEGMASGLPIIVSDRCGCAQDLVINNVNGYVVKHDCFEDLVCCMFKISSLSNSEWLNFSCKSQEIIRSFDLKNYKKSVSTIIDQSNDSFDNRHRTISIFSVIFSIFILAFKSIFLNKRISNE